MSQWTHEIYWVGREQRPVIVIEDFDPHADALVQQAQQGQFTEQTQDFYPGARQELSETARQKQLQPLDKFLKQYLYRTQKKIEIIYSAYSIASTAIAELKPIQCIPHYDSADPSQYALIHYLCDTKLGGTAFYRHRESGLESITPGNQEKYKQQLATQATTVGLPEQSYILGDTALFEQIFKVDAVFNRAIIYPSNLLHSGHIQVVPAKTLPINEQRLTLNDFFKY